MNKRRSTYCRISVRETRAMLSMRPGRWLPPARSLWETLRSGFPTSSPAVAAPAGAALPEPEPTPAMTMTSALALGSTAESVSAPVPAPSAVPEHAHPFLAPLPKSAALTPAGSVLPEPAMVRPSPVHDRSMVSVVVIAVAVTVLAISVLIGTEVALRAFGRASFISAFVGSPSANPGYVYDLILIAIAVLGASLGTAFLLVSAIIGVRLERRQGIMLATDADRADAPAEPAQLFSSPASLETAMR